MSTSATGCQLEVDRGPDWIFIRVRMSPGGVETAPLAEAIWTMIEQHRLYRVVLELDQIELLHSYLIGQFVLVQKRVHTHGGVLRLCGLSSRNENVLYTSRLDTHLPHYANRHEAVLGHVPNKPR